MSLEQPGACFEMFQDADGKPALRIAAAKGAGRCRASSTAPADRPYHLVDLHFFRVGGRIGAKRRPFHGAMAGAG
jgi:hypothetical protein